MRHPNGITELEDQLARHFRLPQPGGRPEDFQKYIYLTQVTYECLTARLRCSVALALVTNVASAALGCRSSRDGRDVSTHASEKMSDEWFSADPTGSVLSSCHWALEIVEIGSCGQDHGHSILAAK